MEAGKPAGLRCVNLDRHNRCTIHNTAAYPAVCKSLRPSQEMCGTNNAYAFHYLELLEELTRVDGP